MDTLERARAHRRAQALRSIDQLRTEMTQPQTPLEAAPRQERRAYIVPQQPRNRAAEAATVNQVMEQIDQDDIDQANALLATLDDEDPAIQTLTRLVRGAQVYINRHRMSQESLF